MITEKEVYFIMNPFGDFKIFSKPEVGIMKLKVNQNNVPAQPVDKTTCFMCDHDITNVAGYTKGAVDNVCGNLACKASYPMIESSAESPTESGHDDFNLKRFLSVINYTQRQIMLDAFKEMKGEGWDDSPIEKRLVETWTDEIKNDPNFSEQ